MAKKAPKETGLPLVFALVFFVLTTIAFGVMWYMQYSDQAAKDEAVAKEKKAASAAAAVQKDAENLVKLYRTYLGIDEGEEKSSMLADQKANDKLATEVKRVNDATAKKLGKADYSQLPPEFKIWTVDGTGKLVETPVTGETTTKGIIVGVANAAKDRDDALAQKKVAEDNWAGVVDAAKKASEAYDKAAKDYVALSDALPKDFDTKLKAEIKKFEDRKTLFTKTEAKSREELTTAEEKTAAVGRERDKLDNRINGRDGLLSQLATLAARAAKSDQNAFTYDEPQGKILRRLPNGVVEIDLGSAALVRPGLTFTVLPHDFPEMGRQSRIRMMRIPDEKGIYKSVERFTEKATIEVIEVLGPFHSRARITSEFDPIRDGAAVGDLLYNSAWRKGAADHIALLGMFDINGDGSDDIESVIRDFTKMGIPVDAYYDMKQRKWVGQLTEQTRFVVEGRYPVQGAVDPNRDDKTKLLGAMADAIEFAKKKGVNTVKFQDFFPRMGYRFKLDVSNDRINQATAPYLNKVSAVDVPPPPGN